MAWSVLSMIDILFRHHVKVSLRDKARDSVYVAEKVLLRDESIVIQIVRIEVSNNSTTM
jgi:hypothetical protein